MNPCSESFTNEKLKCVSFNRNHSFYGPVEISDHCFITSHVVISGNVKIGPYCFLGVNSTIRDGISIGSECVIGAGSVILKNTKDKEVYSINSTKLLPIRSDKLTSI